ncbi:MAG: TrmB family transcriptional regulator [Alphaproteobacteria bacterium]|nr:MAG: TrmB family transcriptional regulator [Alphaproteobacteria bacterium]
MNTDLTLSPLGFTDLESRLYSELLRESPASGYRLAQIVGKAPANVYAGLKSLQAKGAVVSQARAGETSTYIPIPPRELLSGLKQVYDAHHDRAWQVLNSLHQPAVEEHVYRLSTVSQVVERGRSMIRAASEILVFDFSPAVYDLFETELADARARGVVVAGLVYSPEQTSPTQPCVRANVMAGQEAWPALWLTHVVDGEQELMAQLSRDKSRLFNGMWTDSAFLSCAYHDALACEVRLVALGIELDDELKYISLYRFKPPGWRTMEATLSASR